MVKYNDLPNVFGGAKNKAEWEVRREEIKRILECEEYGCFPPKVDCHVESRLISEIEFAGKCVWEELRFTLKNGEKTFSFPAQMIYPKGASALTFYVFINFSSDIPHKYYYPEVVLDRGVGVLTFNYNDVSVDKNTFGDGIERLFLEGERQDTTFGKIVLWAYAMQRGLDYLLTRKEADPNRIVAIGHSRLGKTALVAAGFDERFAMAHSNCSGCSGAAIFREKEGETIRNIYEMCPHWFCKNFKKHMDKENDLPFDQHFLLALIAPRHLAVLTAVEDTWADSYNQYLACLGASRVYQDIYGLKGISGSDERQILCKEYADGNILYREREGTHYLSVDDWTLSVDWFKKK